MKIFYFPINTKLTFIHRLFPLLKDRSIDSENHLFEIIPDILDRKSNDQNCHLMINVVLILINSDYSRFSQLKFQYQSKIKEIIFHLQGSPMINVDTRINIGCRHLKR